MLIHARFLVPFSLLALSSPDLAQEARASEPVLVPGALSVEPGAAARREDTRVPTVFEGFVLEPDGAPAEGAVVVSSAGGQAVTDVAGSYRLEVDVPLDATSVQVTVVGRAGGNLVASASAALAATPGGIPRAIPVGPLQLARGTSCSPSWLPTFGFLPGMSDTVRALAVYDDGNGPALYAGGDFTVAFDSGDSFLAKWGCSDTTPPVLSCPTSIDVRDRLPNGPGEVVNFTVTATDDLDPSPTVVCVPPSGSTFPPGTTMVQCTATDSSGNQSTGQFPVTVLRVRRR